MSFSINSNLGALAAYNSLAKVSSQTGAAQLRLASQKRINSVSDDTSGYQVGKALQGKVSMMKAAQGNIGSAKNLLSTAESALSSINDLIIAIKGKIADANDTTKSKVSLAADINALGAEIKSIFDNTKFNDTALLSTAALTASANSFSFQTGQTSVESTPIFIGSTNALSLSSVTGVNATVEDTALTDIKALTNATGNGEVDKLATYVKDALGSIGNYNQRLDVKDEYLTSAISNANASISRIFDTDMALEQLNSTKNQVGSQISTTMLSQMNQAPGAILSLFR